MNALVVAERAKSGRNGGQPSKLTRTVHKILVDTISKGAHYSTACALAKIDIKTLENWLKWGQEETDGTRPQKTAYFRLFQALTHAEASKELELVEQWQTFAKDEIGVIEEYDKKGNVTRTREKVIRFGDYRAIRDFLERRHRSRWGQQLQVTGPDGGPIEVVKRVIVQSAQLSADPAVLVGESEVIEQSSQTAHQTASDALQAPITVRPGKDKPKRKKRAQSVADRPTNSRLLPKN